MMILDARDVWGFAQLLPYEGAGCLAGDGAMPSDGMAGVMKPDDDFCGSVRVYSPPDTRSIFVTRL